MNFAVDIILQELMGDSPTHDAIPKDFLSTKVHSISVIFVFIFVLIFCETVETFRMRLLEIFCP